jgi:hypothetical protein
MKQINPKVELASGEYDRLLGMPGWKPTIRIVARRCRISERALRNYRANYISRKERLYER